MMLPLDVSFRVEDEEEEELEEDKNRKVRA
jgi:hypothetical protein